MEEIRGVRDDLLEIHGVEPRKKPEGCTWLIYENPDGFNNRISGSEKLDKAKELIDELEADIVAYSEHKINLKHKDNSNGFSQMFNGGEAEVWSVVDTMCMKMLGESSKGAQVCYYLGP